IKDVEQVILIPDRADRPLQVGDALREHQRPRETDAGDLRHRPMDSERVEAEQVDIDVTTEAHEHLERLEGEASPFADVGSNEEDAHQNPSRDSLTRECTMRFRTTDPFPPTRSTLLVLRCRAPVFEISERLRAHASGRETLLSDPARRPPEPPSH